MEDAVCCKLCEAGGLERGKVEGITENLREKRGISLKIVKVVEHGYIAYEKATRHYIVTLGGYPPPPPREGTTLKLTTVKGGSCPVRGIFLQQAKTMILLIRRDLTNIKNMATTVTFTGHGTAGAVATLLAIIAVNESMTPPNAHIRLVTFGAPMLAYSTTWDVKDLMKIHQITARIYINTNDPCPRDLIASSSSTGMYIPVSRSLVFLGHGGSRKTVSSSLEMVGLLAMRSCQVYSKEYHSLDAYSAQLDPEARETVGPVCEGSMTLPQAAKRPHRLSVLVEKRLQKRTPTTPSEIKTEFEFDTDLCREIFNDQDLDRLEAVHCVGRVVMKHCTEVKDEEIKTMVLSDSIQLLSEASMDAFPQFKKVFQAIQGMLYNNLACLRKKNNQLRASFHDLQAAVDLSPSTETYTNLSAVQLSMGSRQGALTTSRKALGLLRPFTSVSATAAVRARFPLKSIVQTETGMVAKVTSHSRGRIGVTSLNDNKVFGCLPHAMEIHPSTYSLGTIFFVWGEDWKIVGHSRGRVGLLSVMGAKPVGLPAGQLTMLLSKGHERVCKELTCIHNYIVAAASVSPSLTAENPVKFRRWEVMFSERIDFLGRGHPLAASLHGRVDWTPSLQDDPPKDTTLLPVIHRPVQKTARQAKKKASTVTKRKPVPHDKLRRREQGWSDRLDSQDAESVGLLLPAVGLPQVALQLEETQYKENTKRRGVCEKQRKARIILKHREALAGAVAQEDIVRHGLVTAANREYKSLLRSKDSKGTLILQQLDLLHCLSLTVSSLTNQEASESASLASHAAILRCVVHEDSHRYLSMRLEAKERDCVDSDCHRGVQELDVLSKIKDETQPE